MKEVPINIRTNALPLSLVKGDRAFVENEIPISEEDERPLVLENSSEEIIDEPLLEIRVVRMRISIAKQLARSLTARDRKELDARLALIIAHVNDKRLQFKSSKGNTTNAALPRPAKVSKVTTESCDRSDAPASPDRYPTLLHAKDVNIGRISQVKDREQSVIKGLYIQRGIAHTLGRIHGAPDRVDGINTHHDWRQLVGGAADWPR